MGSKPKSLSTIIHPILSMTKLIAFDIYRTETIKVGSKILVARLLRRKDHDEYKLHISDEESGKVCTYSHSVDFAKNLSEKTAAQFQNIVCEILQEPLKNDNRPQL